MEIARNAEHSGTIAPPTNDDPPDFAAQRAEWWKVSVQPVSAWQPGWMN